MANFRNDHSRRRIDPRWANFSALAATATDADPADDVRVDEDALAAECNAPPRSDRLRSVRRDGWPTNESAADDRMGG